ncbi:MAG: polysaccharide biosynthesis protein [Defluviitaleaceae bacterium]|nr:polysaccharide biosynthesis protein [Defluviitaleaceae bacterium]
MSRGQKIVAGALILTVAGVITRILGFVYRVYMSNIIGAEGMGLYQLIMPVYSLAWALTCSGFTTTVSKLTAQEKAKGQAGNVRRILKLSVAATTGLGLVTGAVMFFMSNEIAVHFFNDERIGLSLRLLSIAVPFMAAGSCLRGYFLGLQEHIVPAINQVLEQCVRMAVIFLIMGLFLPFGLEYAIAAAVIGIIAEEIFSFVFVVAAYKVRQRKAARPKAEMSLTAASGVIMAMALPLTANRVTGSFLAAFENALIPQRLQIYGMSASEAISAFGQMTGMAMPLIYFPSAFLVSLAISLVPAVSEAHAVKDIRQISYTISKAMLFAAVIGFGSASLFVVFSCELGMAIYNQDISWMLISLGIMSPFLYMQVVLAGILNGLGFQVFIFRNSLISSVINIVIIYFLVPVRGIDAFVLGWLLSLIVIFTLEIRKLQESVELSFEFGQWFVKPFVSCLAAGLFVRFVANRYIFEVFGPRVGLVAAICVFGTMYAFSIILTGCLSHSELDMIKKALSPAKRAV